MSALTRMKGDNLYLTKRPNIEIIGIHFSLLELIISSEVFLIEGLLYIETITFIPISLYPYNLDTDP